MQMMTKNKWGKQADIFPPERDWKVVGINLLRVSEVHSITVVSMHNRMSTNNLELLQRALV